jgi:hypothetical protein
MQYVSISVPRRREYAAQDGFDVYGDGGSGSIDYDHPLNGRLVRFWPQSPPRLGHLLEGHLMLGHLGAGHADGHLQERFLCGLHLSPTADVLFEAGPYCFGRFQHAVVMRDHLGNGDTQDAAIVAKTVNSAPRRAYRVRLESFEGVTDQATFSFIRSPDVG